MKPKCLPTTASFSYNKYDRYDLLTTLRYVELCMEDEKKENTQTGIASPQLYNIIYLPQLKITMFVDMEKKEEDTPHTFYFIGFVKLYM